MPLSSTTVQGNSPTNALLCDGCGRLASPEHLRQRTGRLERATRFRPVHIQVLFIAEGPSLDSGREFYAESGGDPLLDALGIAASAEGLSSHAEVETAQTGRLAAFQKRGLYLAYLVECPLEANGIEGGAVGLVSGTAEVTQRFSPTLLKRIRFSYRPKHIALLSSATRNLVSRLEESGMGEKLLLNAGAPWELGEAGKPSGALSFRAAIEGALAAGATKG